MPKISLASAKLESVPSVKTEEGQGQEIMPVGEDDLKSMEEEHMSDDDPPPRPKSSKKEIVSEPVLVKSILTKDEPPTPAVRITRFNSTFGIFPLPKIELGLVWTEPQELNALQIEVVDGGWDFAKPVFRKMVDYPSEFLNQILRVLRYSKFMNNSLLRWNHWWYACRTTNELLFVPIPCAQCKELRFLSMRSLYSLNNSSTKMVVNCTDLGFVCHQKSEEKKVFRPIERTLTANSSLEASQTTEEDDRQIVLYNPMMSRPKKDNEFVTWSQVAPKFVQGTLHDPQQYFDPYDATQAAPEHFISGYPMLKFISSDPTAEEIGEFKKAQLTSLWRENFRDFTKWSDCHKESQYDGEEDITAVFKWSTAMKARFLSQRIDNPVAKAELASATFTGKARAWWLAHRVRAPKLLVTFDQLLEWIKRELVPHSSTSDAVNAWAELSYSGDAKKYITDLETLINHFPLKRESIIIMATRPLGKEIQKRVQLMDLQYGPAGITISQLKQAISGFLNLNQYSRPYYKERANSQVMFSPQPFQPRRSYPFQFRKDNIPAKERETKMNAVDMRMEPRGPRSFEDQRNSRSFGDQRNQRSFDDQRNSRSFEERKNFARPNYGFRDPNNEQLPPDKRKVGKGPTPCFVCGSDQHAWVNCEKKKKGRCACCGSEAHVTRWCAQRYYPEMRVTFHGCEITEAMEYRYFPENEPVDEDQEITEEEAHREEIQLGDIDPIEEEISAELDGMNISFHMFPMFPLCSMTADTKEDGDIELVVVEDKQHQGKLVSFLISDV